MAQPIFIVKPSPPFRAGVCVYESLWELSRGGTPEKVLPPGRYTVMPAARHEPDWHGLNDGHIYELQGPEGVLGFGWQDVLLLSTDLEDGDDPRDAVASAEWRTLELPTRPPATPGTAATLRAGTHGWASMRALSTDEEPDVEVGDGVGRVLDVFAMHECPATGEDTYVLWVQLSTRRCWVLADAVAAAT